MRVEIAITFRNALKDFPFGMIIGEDAFLKACGANDKK